MNKIVIFDINEKPKLVSDHVAYLVDKSNINLLRQYVAKYYRYLTTSPIRTTWTKWFDDIIGNSIECSIDDKFILYFDSNSLSWDYDRTAVAYDFGYDIYVVKAKHGKQLLKVE